MDLLLVAAVLVGGLLAASTVIVGTKPDARRVFDRLAPFQALIGIGMIAIGALYGVQALTSGTTVLDLFELIPLWALSIVVMISTAIVLGVTFAVPMIARVSPGGAARAERLARNLAPYQTMIGLVSIAAAVIHLLHRFDILKVDTMIR